MSPTTSTTSSNAPRTERTPQAGKRDDVDTTRCAADFERLLRSKGRGPGAGDADDARRDDTPESPLANLLLPRADAPLPFAAPAAAQGQAAAVTPDQAAPRAPMEIPLAARLDLAQAGPADSQAGRSFEVSVNERMGMPLELRVVQPGAAEPGGRWALSVASVHLNPAVLRRYSGRLDERLRTRALSSEPVRIEHDEDA
jgi:hypothetical protein